MKPEPLTGPCLRFRLFGAPVCLHWSFVGVGLGVGAPVGLVSLVVASHLALALFACTAVADVQLGSMGEGFLGQGAAVFAAVNLALLVANAWPSAGSDGLRIARALREWRGAVQ